MNRPAHPPVSSRCTVFMPWLILVFCAGLGPVHAQESAPDIDAPPEGIPTATIEIDGRILFSLRGIPSFPAEKRVEQVRNNIIAAAEDPAVSGDDLVIVESADRTSIQANGKIVINVFDVDGQHEGIDRKLLAGVFQVAIAKAIKQYRHERSTPVLLKNSGFALGITLLMALILWGAVKFNRWFNTWAAQRVQKHLSRLADKSHQLIRAGQVWTLVAALLRILRFLFIVVLVYFYLNTVLGLYPWTRPAALILFDLILSPLESLWQGFLSAIPNLMFLFVLYLVVRYIIKLTRLFFEGVENERIKLKNFDHDWAQPTYKIVRLLIIAFGLVVAYPYIPGSDSMAFKGVSLFLGVIVSLGSSSFIANMMAGLSMTYRGAFKEGERVRIGDVMGTVDEIKLMVTRIRTPKNEIVIIPNSNILNTNVVNYSTLAHKQGLVLHTVVGIGYETPWRQVEAMLLQAAARTQGIMTDPKPFVLQLALGDFAVTYELNVYVDDETRMLALYSALHANIQDLFNEHGVQIMTPAYEGDPETPKVVPPEQWYTAPAVKPNS